MAGLHRHHDHAVSSAYDLHGRFPAVVLCDQCNSADGLAKRRLKLPENFSFSPSEIGRFVSTTPHGKHSIDLVDALALYEAHAGRQAAAQTERVRFW
jgi:hypothetical protein